MVLALHEPLVRALLWDLWDGAAETLEKFNPDVRFNDIKAAQHICRVRRR